MAGIIQAKASLAGNWANANVGYLFRQQFKISKICKASIERYLTVAVEAVLKHFVA